MAEPAPLPCPACKAPPPCKCEQFPNAHYQDGVRYEFDGCGWFVAEEPKHEPH